MEPEFKEGVYCFTLNNAPPHGRHLVKQWQIETIRGSALIGRGVRPMGASVCAETIVRRVAAESRLFLVGPALLAISVSRRAGRRGRTVGGRTFLFTNLPPTSPPPHHHHHRRRLRRSPCVFVRWQSWWSSTSPPQKPFAFWDALKSGLSLRIRIRSVSEDYQVLTDSFLKGRQRCWRLALM